MRSGSGFGPAPSFLKMRQAYQPLRPTQKGRPIWTAPLAVVEDATDLFSPNASYRCQRIRPLTVRGATGWCADSYKKVHVWGGLSSRLCAARQGARPLGHESVDTTRRCTSRRERDRQRDLFPKGSFRSGNLFATISGIQASNDSKFLRLTVL